MLQFDTKIRVILILNYDVLKIIQSVFIYIYIIFIVSIL